MPAPSQRFLPVLAAGLFLWSLPGQAQDFDGRIFDPAPRAEVTLSKAGVEALGVTPETLNAVSDYETQLISLESTEGPFSMALAEQLQGLANQYQRLDEHGAAITQLETARHIVRVNHGLFSMQQVRLVEEMIESHSALNNIEEVNELQEYLYYLNQKNFEEDGATHQLAQLALADWYVQAHLRNPKNLEAFTSDGSNRTPRLSEYVTVYDPFTNSYRYVHRSTMNSGFAANGFLEAEPNATRLFIQTDPYLDKARELYLAMLPEAGTADSATDLSRNEIRYKLAGISFLIKNQVEFLEQQALPGGSRIGARRNSLIIREYLNGLDLLDEILVDTLASPGVSPQDIARIQLDMADWHLSFDEPGRARDRYRDAYLTLAAANLSEEAIKQILAPSEVLFVPRFADRPNSREVWGIGEDEPLDYQGYVDLEFHRDSQGNLSDIVIVDRSEDTSSKTENQIVRLLRQQKSRPTIDQGEAVAENNLALRYYYTH